MLHVFLSSIGKPHIHLTSFGPLYTSSVAVRIESCVAVCVAVCVAECCTHSRVLLSAYIHMQCYSACCSVRCSLLHTPFRPRGLYTHSVSECVLQCAMKHVAHTPRFVRAGTHIYKHVTCSHACAQKCQKKATLSNNLDPNHKSCTMHLCLPLTPSLYSRGGGIWGSGNGDIGDRGVPSREL